MSEVRKPSVTFQTLGGGDASAEGIVVLAAVNTAPTVEVTLRRAATDVIRPLSVETLDAMRRAQEARFAVKTIPDTTITAVDGNGSTLTFRGFVAAPALEHGTLSNSETVNVVGEDALLDGLGLSIYHSRPDPLRAQALPDLFNRTPSKVTGDIGQLIAEVTEVLTSNLAATLDLTADSNMRELIQLKHAANELPLASWLAILNNSDVVYKNWEAPLKRAPVIGQAIATRIQEMLQQRSSSFWGVIHGLSSEFQFFYRPNVDGSPGRFVRVDQKIHPEGRLTLNAGVTRFSASDGAAAMLPLGGVILYGPPMAGTRDEVKLYSATATVGRWPVTITPGYFLETSAPAWMSTGGFLQFATQEALDPVPLVGPPDPNAPKIYDPAAYAAQREKLQQRIAVIADDRTKMLQDYAKVIYEDMRLADSTATLEIPLDFSVEVGVRYRFRMGQNQGYFDGFVRALRHTLQLQNGDTLTSGTVLSLTHVVYS